MFRKIGIPLRKGCWTQLRWICPVAGGWGIGSQTWMKLQHREKTWPIKPWAFQRGSASSAKAASISPGNLGTDQGTIRPGVIWGVVPPLER